MPLFRAPDPPIVTFANLPAIGSMHKAILCSNYGANGNLLIQGSARWLPANGIALLKSQTVPSAEITNAADTQVFTYAFPAGGFLKIGDRLRFIGTLRKSGAVDAGLANARLGTNGTVADTAIWSLATAMGSGSRIIGSVLEWRVETATSVLMLGPSSGTNFAAAGFSQTATGAQTAAVTIDNISGVLNFGISISSAGATNTVALEDGHLYHIPANV